MAEKLHFKDEVLDELSRDANVAQFVSFSPNEMKQRFCRIEGFDANHRFRDPTSAIKTLLLMSPESSVNVRSFEPDQPRSRTFIYGISKVSDVLAHLRSLSDQGLYSIVNETIDVDDGGVSGVAFGGVLEFAPASTPRCVEAPGTAQLPFDTGIAILQTVYGFRAELPSEPETRTEFSIHPICRGFRKSHTVLWEQENLGSHGISTEISWPNKFSRHLGDKAFGLLVADALGLAVPRTVVVSRALAPFSFGSPTGTYETWLRTCPIEQAPGQYTTQKGWADPFQLMQQEDPDGDMLASILAQEGVPAEFSGALLTDPSGQLVIEGRRGSGEDFMQGAVGPGSISPAAILAVKEVYQQAFLRIGALRMEWVFDGARAWVVQLHSGASKSIGRRIFPGSPEVWHELPADASIDALRTLIGQIDCSREGVVLRGEVGMTSHKADLLRKARIPSLIDPSGDSDEKSGGQMGLFEG